MSTSAAPVKVTLLTRAREAQQGTCMLCGCSMEKPCTVGLLTCSWVSGTKVRLCTAHPPVEREEAKRALRRADKERR